MQSHNQNRMLHGLNQPPNKGMSNKDPLSIKIAPISEWLGKVIDSIEQPSIDSVQCFYGREYETTASRRWWNLAKLRHVLTDIDFYVRQRESIQLEYNKIK